MRKIYLEKIFLGKENTPGCGTYNIKNNFGGSAKEVKSYSIGLHHYLDDKKLKRNAKLPGPG